MLRQCEFNLGHRGDINLGGGYVEFMKRFCADGYEGK